MSHARPRPSPNPVPIQPREWLIIPDPFPHAVIHGILQVDQVANLQKGQPGIRSHIMHNFGTAVPCLCLK